MGLHQIFVSIVCQHFHIRIPLIRRVTQVYLIDIQGSPDLLRRISGVGITPNMCKYIFACMQVSMRIFIDMWGEPGISNRLRGNWNDTK